MNPKSILVALAAGPSAKSATKGAAMIAAAHKARLIGLHVLDINHFIGYMGAEMPAEIFDLQREKLMADAAQVEVEFKSICEEAGIDFEWHCIEGNTQRLIDQHARYADLICVCAPPASADAFTPSPIGEELVFSSGRPVLIFPQEFSAATVGDQVMLAWDGSQEAAKAISQSMGILSAASQVSLVCVADHDLQDAQADTLGTDMNRYLKSHDVQAEAITVHAGSTAVGPFLHDCAIGHRADLLVMGAYGHSRIREFILGGVTHWALRHSTIPILMCH